MKGAANVSLSMKDIAGVEVPLPPIEKQRELSLSLEKVANLEKKIQKSEAIAKLLRQRIIKDAFEEME